MADAFISALRRTITDLTLSCGVAVVWKDADPASWSGLPPELSTHVNPYCVAVKRDARRRACCIGVDGLEDGDFAPHLAFRERTCPFGVHEVLVPIRAGGIYHGCCLVGPWRGAGEVVSTTHPALPEFPGRARAAAIARLVAAAMTPLVADRTASRAARAAADDPLMRRAQAWIEAHLSAGLRASTVAAAVGLSSSRFVHRFAEGCGTPVGPYLRRRLMEEAARRLVSSPVTMGALASDLGFTSHSRFCEAFRRHHGCAPTAFRRRTGG